MSLINDALKRAKQAQQDTTPAPPSNSDLRPVDPRQYSRPAVGMAVPALLGIASLVLLCLLWQAARTSSSNNDLEVKARTKAPTPAPVSPAPETVASAPPVVVQPAAPAPAPVATAVGKQTPSGQSSSNNLSSVAAVAPDPASNAAPVVAVAPPKPALPKLQAIVFHPTRPSVLINGKSLFVGEKVGEFRVRSIEQDSVTIVGAGQTNVLMLPE